MEKTSFVKTEYVYVSPGTTLLAPLTIAPILILGDGEDLSRNYQIHKSNAQTCEARFNAIVDWHERAAKKYPPAVAK